MLNQYRGCWCLNDTSDFGVRHIVFSKAWTFIDFHLEVGFNAVLK